MKSKTFIFLIILMFSCQVKKKLLNEEELLNIDNVLKQEISNKHEGYKVSIINNGIDVINTNELLHVVKYKLNNSISYDYYLYDKSNVSILFKGDDYYKSFNLLLKKLYEKDICRQQILYYLKKFMALNISRKEFDYFYCDFESDEKNSLIKYEDLRNKCISYLIKHKELRPDGDDYDIQLDYFYLAKVDFYKGLSKNDQHIKNGLYRFLNTSSLSKKVYYVLVNNDIIEFLNFDENNSISTISNVVKFSRDNRFCNEKIVISISDLLKSNGIRSCW